VAWLKDHFGDRAGTPAFLASAGLLLVGLMLSLLISDQPVLSKET
jgi:hypothetical protein